MNINTENSLTIFTDGSSLGNPGPGGWGVIMVYPRLNEVIELGGTKLQTTNNEMELTAIVSALSYAAHNTEHVHLYTDSEYAIKGATEWMYGWVKNGWTTASKEPVKNQSIWKTLFELIEERGRTNITWHHVRGHVGIPGNERVDDIARELAEGTNVQLYRGTLSKYSITNILDIPDTSDQPKKKTTKSAATYSYLSLLNGVLERHDTWAACEARVSGTNAKFKKALSKEHEDEILKDWNITT
ncbi:ribonuclease HI [Patescibacteria group bacterium]|nr:ribonuclease HI [Patescibacteria group bacterium]